MNKRIITLALASTLALPTWAQKTAVDHSAHQAAAGASAATLADGEVRKVDKAAQKLTIRHGEIKSLDMPPMTMVYQVKDGAMLNKLKAGDKVRFAAEKVGEGFVVTDIRPAP